MIARRAHVSIALARAGLWPSWACCSSTGLGTQVAAELELEEIALLLGCTPVTKKVQTIFEEAQKIREAEAVEEIGLAWRRPEPEGGQRRSYLWRQPGPPGVRPKSGCRPGPEPRKKCRPRKMGEEPKVEKMARP